MAERGDRQATALLVVDMINLLDFPGGDAMRPDALAAARQIAKLKKKMKAGGAPVIYANDNFMRWQADFRDIVAVCLQDERARPITELLAPERGDYFVLKPKHSAFFETPLPTLLDKLDVRRLVIAGVAADGCILASATDAHMREFIVQVPRDCVASISQQRTDRALALMKASMGLDVRTARYVEV